MRCAPWAADEDEAWLLANTDRLGGPMTYGSYPAGWAWAMNTPLRWTKQYASMLGRHPQRHDPVLAGPCRPPGAVCGEFGASRSTLRRPCSRLPGCRRRRRSTARAEADRRQEPADQPLVAAMPTSRARSISRSAARSASTTMAGS